MIYLSLHIANFKEKYPPVHQYQDSQEVCQLRNNGNVAACHSSFTKFYPWTGGPEAEVETTTPNITTLIA